jgi:hypothetical protein
MLKAHRRKISLLVFVLVSLLVGLGVTVAAVASRPEAVRQLWVSASVDRSGTAQITETIDYHFRNRRHGIYRDLPDLSAAATSQVQVSSDTYHDVAFIPDPVGTRIRIGSPFHTISGNHTYVIHYPLTTLVGPGGRFGWNAVGTSWTVPIQHTEVDVVAAWQWEQPSCSAGSSGSYGNCTVTQPQPGHLVVSHGRLGVGQGITVYATRGAALPAAPAVRPVVAPPTEGWASQPLTLGLLAALMALLTMLVTARLLRRQGRDWVVAAAAASGNAAALAYEQTGNQGPVARVDDTTLEQYVTTEFAPPKGLAPWQGGIVSAESVRNEHRVAWLIGAAIDGYIDLEQAGDSTLIRPKPHAPDAVTAQLEAAFYGRPELALGHYDSHFSSMWQSLPATFEQWRRASGLQDAHAERLARVVRPAGVVLAVLSAFGLFVFAALQATIPIGALIGTALAALGFGLGLALFVRAWELHVRTPAGSALWLRVESFRRFLANSEGHHAAEAAQRGVLREYTAWAVAVGEVDHWSRGGGGAGPPPNTSGLSTALIATSLMSSTSHTATAPAPSGGGGGFGGGGVGGGGGGGGGGSW